MKGKVERDALFRPHEFEKMIFLALRGGRSYLVKIGGAFKEITDGNAQNIRHLKQTAGPDAVDTFFVFLDLLERNAERLAQFLLRHADLEPLQPYPASDIAIDGIASFDPRLAQLPTPFTNSAPTPAATQDNALALEAISGLRMISAACVPIFRLTAHLAASDTPTVPCCFNLACRDRRRSRRCRPVSR